MAEKSKSFRSNLRPDEALPVVRAGIASWKMGRVCGLKPAGDDAYTITRAGKQSGSLVEYWIEATDGGSSVTVRLATTARALKNPFTGVFASVEKSLRKADPHLVVE